MKVIVCVDKEMGMAFLGRRQSRDRVLTQDLINDLIGSELYIHPKTLKVFESFDTDFLKVSESPLTECDSTCFVELESPLPVIERVDTLVIYHWNTDYPSTVKLGFTPKEVGFKLSSKNDFKGYSHDKITKEVWVRS